MRFLAPRISEDRLFVSGFALIFFLGLLLANPILISASVIPLLVHFLLVFIAPPKVEIQKIDLPSSAGVDETAEVRITGKITGGPGAAVVYVEVPEVFQLVEGSNYMVVSKGFDEKTFDFGYKIKCTKHGYFRLGVGTESRHVLGLTLKGFSFKESASLMVLPTLPRVRKIRVPLRMKLRTHPSGSIAKIGPLSTDFKEIRDYSFGDPFKIINWKATAKAARRREMYPMVNEYEREGKLAIWLFLDGSPDLRIGTSVKSTSEYSVWLAYSLSYYFLSKGYSLGMSIYNHRGEKLHFDTGRKQFFKVVEKILKLTTSQEGLDVAWDFGFSRNVERNRSWLTTQATGIIVITHVTPSNWADLQDGLRRMMIYGKGKAKNNVLLINVLPYGIVPKTSDLEVFASDMLDTASRSLSKKLRYAGLTVLEWDPTEENVEAALLSTTRMR